MRKNIDKFLVVITSAIAVLFSTIVLFVDMALPKDVASDNALSFGNQNSEIQLVLFEDFNCKYCKHYFNEIFSGIKKNYIDTDQISYKIIPIALSKNSEPLANAAIYIYGIQKDRFFEFIKIISYQNLKNPSKNQLIDIARSLNGININSLSNAIDNNYYSKSLKENAKLAKKLMGDVEVPVAFINGARVSLDEIKYNLNQKLNDKTN